VSYQFHINSASSSQHGTSRCELCERCARCPVLAEVEATSLAVRVAASLLPRHAAYAFAADDGLQLTPRVGSDALAAGRAEAGRARVASDSAVALGAVDAAHVSSRTVSLAGASAPAGSFADARWGNTDG
jgi:hypothetical protein